MIQYLIAAIVALLVALGFSGWVHIQQAKTAGELGQQLSAAKGLVQAVQKAQARTNAATLVARQETAREEAAAKAVSRAVETVLLSETTWAGTPVPKSILEALDANTDPDDLGGVERLLHRLPEFTTPSAAGAVPGAPSGDPDERGPTPVGPGPEAGPQEMQH